METAFFTYLLAYHELAIFIGTLLFGDAVILAAAFLSGQSYVFSPISVFSISVLGVMVVDALWFMLGKKIARRFIRVPDPDQKRLFDRLYRMSHGRPFLLMFFSKFVYGTRILSIMTVSLSRLSTGRFLIYNIPGIFLLHAGLVFVGYMAGRGSSHLIHNMQNLQTVISILFVSTLVLWGIGKWIQRRILLS